MKRKLGYNWTGKEYFNRYMCIVYPSDKIRILDFNRLFKTLNGKTTKGIIKSIKNNFHVKKLGKLDAEKAKPKKKYTYGLYIEKQWYQLRLKEELLPYSG